ncbi:unnamed protein product [Hermetia illucens]|uniref:Gamma-tubulin complex component n=1 Tax=Hermetia illucens TaxID=343691 RepID=A0A7R8USD4_HERIL|nr:gamma-tubulin complex component 4 homolog [Hermetia illucens]CAD7086154.1 unnamed protein product [Hermetia illucens]
MIHDILLSLSNPHSARIPIEDLMVSDAISMFLHPCEKKILEEILKIIREHREIATFTRNYGLNTKAGSLDLEDPLQRGLYLQALASGIDNVLDKYLESIAKLEKDYLQNPSHSLLFIYHKVDTFQPLFSFLLKVVRDLKMQRLHGCAILQYLHQHMMHGDDQINKAVKMIQSSVNVVFLKQLTHWLLYGKVLDTYGEFFVQCSESRNSTLGSTSAGSGRHTATTLSDATSTYAEIWHYEICYEFLPHYLPPSWAEKVLFIGQTVLMFKVDASKKRKDAHSWHDSEKHNFGESLYNEKEHVFFKMIQELQYDPRLNVAHYERVIDEIKRYVTERLSQIAVDQADLMKQLKLIKDFFLLGRGELFLEFIKRTHSINRSPVTDATVRDLVKAFDSAAHSVNVTEDLEQFSFTIPKERIDNDDLCNFGYLQYITLQYKINWPLHLLFSPKVIERYNELFRFLMLIKRTQYDLHMIWCFHRENRVHMTNVKLLQLRNQLMFLVDNLQYYILIDVLESQYSILMNTVLDSTDFEHIQRAHCIFQANVLSLCFLLTDEEPSKTNVMNSIENPVLTILNKIFHLCDEFCNFAKTAHSTLTEQENTDYNLLEKEFEILIDKLLNLLIGLKAGSTSTPLSQFLLRLDYNHWFSTRKEEKQT